MFCMVMEDDEFKVVKDWNKVSAGVCIKVVEIYEFDGDEIVVYKNDSSNMEIEVERSVFESGVESGCLRELDESREFRI